MFGEIEWEKQPFRNGQRKNGTEGETNEENAMTRPKSKCWKGILQYWEEEMIEQGGLPDKPRTRKPHNLLEKHITKENQEEKQDKERQRKTNQRKKDEEVIRGGTRGKKRKGKRKRKKT